MGNKSPSLGIFQLVREFFGRVRRIRWTGHAASPDDAKVGDNRVNVVGCKKAKYISLVPFKDVLQAASKRSREIPNIAKRV